MGIGSKVSVAKDAILNIGSNFMNSAKMTIICTTHISIGDNFLSSWDTFVMDSDFHSTINVETGMENEVSKPILIGKNVWMGMKSTILKGVNVPDGSIIGAASMVSKSFCNENCLLASAQAEVKKIGVTRIIH